MTTNAPATTNGNQQENVPAISPPRLPYHPAIQERFGVDKASWKALVEAIFPGAQSVDSIIMVLSYCKARQLDPFKRNVHIVPIWDSDKRRMVDTVWPGIGELRTTAFRTRAFAGRDETRFGPDMTRTWEYQPKSGPSRQIEVTFPEWAQVSVYRMVEGHRVAFAGPRVYWLETYSQMGKSDAPNSMWQKRPRGQLDKCAEAAALRAAFPEELGDDHTIDESGMVSRLPSADESKPGLPPDGRSGFGFGGTRKRFVPEDVPDQVDKQTGEVAEQRDTHGGQGEPQQAHDEAGTTGADDNSTAGDEPAGGDAAAEGAGGGDGPEPPAWERLAITLAERCDCSVEDAEKTLSEQAGMSIRKLTAKSLANLSKQVASGEIAV